LIRKGPTAQSKRKIEAARSTDVEDPTGEDVRILKEFAGFLRQRGQKARTGEAKEDILFGSWPLGLKGSLGRREIYDHL
jgi:hypothetical protein